MKATELNRVVENFLRFLIVMSDNCIVDVDGSCLNGLVCNLKTFLTMTCSRNNWNDWL